MPEPACADCRHWRRETEDDGMAQCDRLEESGMVYAFYRGEPAGGIRTAAHFACVLFQPAPCPAPPAT